MTTEIDPREDSRNRAALANANIGHQQNLSKPIPHDGWLSRTYVSCSVAFLLLVGLLAYVFLSTEKLTAPQFLGGLGLAVALLLIGLGLVKVDKVLELIRLKLTGGKV